MKFFFLCHPDAFFFEMAEEVKGPPVDFNARLLVGAPGGREIPHADPAAFLEFSEIAVRVKSQDDWASLLKPIASVAAVYNQLTRDQSTVASTFTTLCDTNILPMPVCAAPLIVAMGMFTGKPAPLYTSAFTSLYELTLLRIFMRDVCYSREKAPALFKAVSVLHDALEKDLGDATLTLKARLDTAVYFPYRDGKINQANAVYQFVQAMEAHTMYVLNRNECFIYDALSLAEPETRVQLCHIITSSTTFTGYLPTGAELIALDPQGVQWKRLIAIMERVFTTRSMLWNQLMRKEREQRGEPAHVDVRLFNTENLVDRVFQALMDGQADPKRSQLYRGWLLFETAREYCDLLNMQFVSEQQLLEFALRTGQR